MVHCSVQIADKLQTLCQWLQTGHLISIVGARPCWALGGSCRGMHRLLGEIVVLLFLGLISGAVALVAATAAAAWVPIRIMVPAPQAAHIWRRPCCCRLHRRR